MLFIANILILIGLFKVLKSTQNPLLVAGIYGVVVFILTLATGGGLFLEALIFALIKFAMAFVYFWLLNKIGGGTWWWVVAILGLIIGII